MLPNSPTSTNRPRHATCRSLPETHSNRSLSQADRNQPVLRSVKIILVSPKIPENIGATLRAASNFEAGRVCVVDPRCDPYSDIISVVACNSPLLHSIQVVPSLRDALAESQVSVGFTRRAGSGRVIHPSLRSLTSQFPNIVRQPGWAGLTGQNEESAEMRDGGSNPISPKSVHGSNACTEALVFGREESGLLDSEVLLCSHICAIPTGQTFPSMNLSHAVAVVLSQLFQITADMEAAESNVDVHRNRILNSRREIAGAPANHAEIDALLRRAGALLTAAGIAIEESSGGGDKGNHGRRRKPLGYLRHMLTRSQANTAEVRAMHYLLKDIEASFHSSKNERKSRPL